MKRGDATVLMTVDEAAERLRVKMQSLRDPRYRMRIGLKAIRIGGSLRFREADIEQIIEEGEEQLPIGAAIFASR